MKTWLAWLRQGELSSDNLREPPVSAARIEPVVYTIEERERLREALVESARADPRISGAAITGSAAVGASDR